MRTIAALACIGSSAMAPAFADEVEHEPTNTGQDLTKPIARVDVRQKYIEPVIGPHSDLLTLRADKPFMLDGGWKIATRFDLPFMGNEVVSPDNRDGSYDVGLSDALIQVLAITPPHGKWAFAFGGQLIFDTASQDQLGAGRSQVAPMIAAVHQLPEISPGTFVGGLIRGTLGVGDGRRFDDRLSVQPLFNLALPNKWFATFSPEIQFNLDHHGDLFLPFDMTIGRLVTNRVVMSLQTDVALVDDFPIYDWQMEARVGFFF